MKSSNFNFNFNYRIAVWVLCISLLASCGGGKADNARFKLEHHQNVPAGTEIKVSLVRPSSLEGEAGLRFDWSAADGKFKSDSSNEPSNFYTAPNLAVTDKITVIVWQGTTILGTAQSDIAVGGTRADSDQSPPAEGQSNTQPATGGAAAVDALSNVSVEALFFPAGWMGDAQAGRKYVQVDSAWQDNPYSAPTCYKWTYRPGEQGWAAVGWQYPENNFGSQPGRDLTGYSKLTVRLRGEKGNEVLTLKAGGHTIPGARYPASFEALPVIATLGRDWQRFEIKLSGKLTNIPCAFVWTAARQENPSSPVIFYMDDLQLEK